MPPRLHCISRFRPASFLIPQISTLQPAAPLLPFLYPSTTTRSSSILSSLRDNKGAIKVRQRKGRGPSSGRGQKSGRGHTGQKSRSGYKLPKGFEGGQTRQRIVNPPGGFKNHWAKPYTTLSLSKLTNFISQGRINPTYPITLRELLQSRCVSNIKAGVKLLASGHESLSHYSQTHHPINIVVSRASAQAIQKIEEAGGSVHTRYYTEFAARQIMKGRMDPVNSLQSRFPEEIARAAGKESVKVEGGQEGKELEGGTGVVERRKKYLYRLPDPVHRKEIEYYRDPAHRGYLAHLVKEGESPSLFWKVPKEVEKGLGLQMERKVKKKLAENRIF